MTQPTIKTTLTDEINEVGVPIRVYAEVGILKNGKTLKCGLACSLHNKSRLETLETDGKRAAAHYWASEAVQAVIAKGMQ